MSEEHLLTRGSSVWRDFYGFVYNNLRTQGVSHFDAEDLTQDVLETAYTHLDTVDPRRQHAWLATVSRNKVVDKARWAKPVCVVAELPDAADPGLGPDDILIRSVDRQRLLAAISLLAERDRLLVEIRYLQDRSVLETAEELGMSVGATKVALHRARERLREILETTDGAKSIRPTEARGVSMAGIAGRAVMALTPYIGRMAADTCVRGTAVSIGKTLDTLAVEDMDALAYRINAVLCPLLPSDTIERLIGDIRGGVL
ncbi:MAG: sigma-70 family RNA polymerase sigma factor [Coriobacteriia bacterium]|nr:sigma-70 family RNA polymerase sigma factor [Coriobacteriia bacterium]